MSGWDEGKVPRSTVVRAEAYKEIKTTQAAVLFCGVVFFNMGKQACVCAACFCHTNTRILIVLGK